MKKMMFMAAVFAACFTAAAAEPVLSYSYANGTQIKGKYKAPIIEGETMMLDGMPTAMRLDAKKHNFMTVPGGEKFSLEKGGTLYSIIRVDPKADYAMVFFKPGELLLGYYRGNLYFNFTGKDEKKTFENTVYLGSVPKNKWISLAASFAKVNGEIVVRAYSSGRSFVTKFKKDYKPGNGPLTIGKGWGGVWYFSGDIALIQAYDVALSEAELKALDKKSPFKL